MIMIRPARATRSTLIFGVFLALSCPFPSQAQPQPPPRTVTKFYPDFSDTADALLRNAASHARDRQWAEAIDIYQRVIQQFGEKVARLPKEEAEEERAPGESVLYVDLRNFCQRRIAALPPEARAIYRSRVDAQAERWYQQGTTSRDRSSLRRVIDQAFCSSWGDDAINLLGDLAFEDGRFDEALALYRRLVPDPSARKPALAHPDPDVDMARVAAKKLLCQAALGEGPQPPALEAFGAAYPGASGELAGRKGSYLKALTEALSTDHLAPPAQPDGRWPTFAGSPTRTKIVPGNVDVGSMQWRVELPSFDQAKSHYNMRGFPRPMGMSQPAIPKDRLLMYHPIVLGDQVIVATDNRIQAYNLNARPEGTAVGPSVSVRPVWEAPPEGQETPTATATMPLTTVPRYTLTAFGDRIYARLGPPASQFMMGMGGPRTSVQSKIVAVDRSTEGKILWTKISAEITLPKSPQDGMSRVNFEGTPVADGRNVYAAMTDRREQTSTYVVCLDAETGNLRWVRYLGAASTDNENMIAGFGMAGMNMGASGLNDFGHRLLSLDGPTIYYQTNLGAVVALDSDTGSVRWVATYPRQDRLEGGANHSRDLNPAIVHDGLVMVAPDDANCLYAFDAESGRLAWKSKPIPAEVKLAHLLGVAKGHLVATGDHVVLYDVKTGDLFSMWPDNGHAYEGFGRGLLAGDRIYWPTKNEIHVLDQSTGVRSDPPIKLQESFQTTGGNLAVGDGYLIVSQPDALVVFCQNSRLIQRYRDEIVRAPDRALNYYRLAQAAEATGQDDLALESLTTAASKVRPSDMIDGTSLSDATRDQQFRLLMRLGSKAKGDKAWPVATGKLQAASTVARSDRDRLNALLTLADVQLESGEPRDAVATLQGLLADEPLRSLSVASEGGQRLIRADLLIADRLNTILRAHGRNYYAEFEREAQDLLQRGKSEKDTRLLEEVGRSYPASEVVADSLLALGQLSDSLNRPAEAAHAYKRLLAVSPNASLRARALWGQAQAYEAQKLWVPAREAYLDVQARFGEVHLDDFPADARISSLVAERLGRAPFDQMLAERSEPKLPIPLVKRWGRTLPHSVRPIAAAGSPPSNEGSRLFLARGSELSAVDPREGSSLWSKELRGTTTWVGYLADKIIAASENRIYALKFDNGSILWTYESGGGSKETKGANPFAKEPPGVKPADNTPKLLHDFQVVGDRVFCLRGEGELVALDGDSGLVDWAYSPTAGTINPLMLIGPQRVIVQLRKPNAMLVLETGSGRRLGEFPRGGDEDWARTPLLIDDDHVVLVPDRRTVELFDLHRGVESWVFRESRELPKNGPPRLLGGSERLFVIHDGSELIRLDPATGTKRWSRPLGSENLSERPDATAIDNEHVYWTSNRTLRAASLEDGKLIWSSYLLGPESYWSVALTERCVMGYPTLGDSGENELTSLPLVFRRRDNGELVQRILLPVGSSEVAVRLNPQGALVASRGGIWTLGERKKAEVAPKSP
ncbi:PQQ-binding-like beta-propeller repeat protein [Singulisphaera sp. PoT]|uniref:outer membrane protein assembly factor BamB family protein n=1 Tax=Singulisphaera sp. PoT TaxID=3411797 RepID=UPI003BF5940A